MLPENFTEVIIDGGNHACFGMYGEATVTAKRQIDHTAARIAEFIIQKTKKG